MTSEELNVQLYEKMKEEQEKYREWILAQPPEEILNHAFEYCIREDILLAVENDDLNGRQAKVLLSSPAPLADIFEHWEKYGHGYMDDVWDMVQGRANKVMREDIARSHGEER